MNKIFISVASVLLFLLSSSCFVIKEGERGVILKLNRSASNSTDKEILYYPGLHWKVPFLYTVKKIDGRIHTIDFETDHFIEKEKKSIIINAYIKWRINDFYRYCLATGGGNIVQAEILLKRKFNDALHSQMSSFNIKQIINTSEGKLKNNILHFLNIQDFNIKNSSLKNFNKTSVLGIEVIDMRIKKINFSLDMLHLIYNRMQSEKKLMANIQRSDGFKQAAILRSLAHYNASLIISKAKQDALIIKGENESKIIKILSKIFNTEPNLYFFIHSLQMYEEIFRYDPNIILIELNKQFFQHFNKMIQD